METAALVLTLLLPWLQLHFLAGAEIATDLVVVLFLVHSLVRRDFAWARQGWVWVGLAWWAWLVLCTAVNLGQPGTQWIDLGRAAAMLRLVVLAAALQCWVLAAARSRRWFQNSLTLATLYVALQTLLQFSVGRNLFGAPRYADGSLTGPYTKPRAGPNFVRMLFPALLPSVGALLGRKPIAARAAGVALLLLGVGVVVLIGQRIPVLLGLLGLVLSALLLPRLRVAVAAAIVLGGVLVAATVVISPPTYYRLVTKFSDQMAHFPDSPYGQIAARSLAIAGQNPWMGRGYDGFRHGCPEPRYFEGWHWPGQVTADQGGGEAMCVTHPHNFYLQALTDAGVPGLVLFCVLVGWWLVLLGRGLVRRPDPWRAGLFVAAFIQAWPLASNSALPSVPVGLWFFLLVGVGLAEARVARPATP